MSSTTPAEEFWSKAYLVLSFFCLIFLVHDFFDHRPHGSRCGVVEKRIIPQDVDVHKSVATVNYNEYFIVHYDDGAYEKVKVDTNTFYTHKEKSRICFDVPPYYSPWYIGIALISGFILIIDLILAAIVGVQAFNEYLNK